MKSVILFLCLLAPLALRASHPPSVSEADRKVFQDAVAAYDAGNYAEAIARFNQIIAGSGDNAELRYDLGDSYFRNKELGKAIYEYRKGVELSPRDPDLKFNLAYARKRVPDRIEERGLAGVELPWTEKEAWYVLAFASILFWGSCLVALFRREASLKWVKGTGLALLGLGLLAGGAKRVATRPFGVVTAPEAEVFSGVGKDNVLLFKLHEGAEFSVGSREGEWIQITLADGKKGWVREKDVIL